MACMIVDRPPGTQRHWLGRLGKMWDAGAKREHLFSTPFVGYGIPSVRPSSDHATCILPVTNLSPATLARPPMSSPAAAGSSLVFFKCGWGSMMLLACNRAIV